MPKATTPPKIPRALARACGGNAVLRSASARGAIRAAPAPCSARAAISQPALSESAQAADATANRARPLANMRLRPKRSPRAAPVIRSTARLRTYALTVHSRSATEAPSWRRIVVSAVDTIRVSRATSTPVPEARPKTQLAVDLSGYEAIWDSSPGWHDNKSACVMQVDEL